MSAFTATELMQRYLTKDWNFFLHDQSRITAYKVQTGHHPEVFREEHRENLVLESLERDFKGLRVKHSEKNQSDRRAELVLIDHSSRIKKIREKRWAKREILLRGLQGLYKNGVRQYPLAVHQKKETIKDKMARTATKAQVERHLIHLIMRVLSLRAGTSPFTLLLDDLSQRAMPVLEELFRRAISSNTTPVFITFQLDNNLPSFVRQIPIAGNDTSEQILSKIENVIRNHEKKIVIIDSLEDLIVGKGVDTTALFELVAVKHASMLFGVWHQDAISSGGDVNAYNPQPLEAVKYMATTIITCRSFAHALAAKVAKERSLLEPTFGLLQGADGIVQALDANDTRGIVLEAEFRRQSGRPESSTYFLRPAVPADYHPPINGQVIGPLRQEFAILLHCHPVYANEEVANMVRSSSPEIKTTFDLGLTDKQKQARDGVVLPYHDAQNPSGDAGEGGRILYDMGSEDDFDEEEDEI